jgi:hypothetical protein
MSTLQLQLTIFPMLELFIAILIIEQELKTRHCYFRHQTNTQTASKIPQSITDMQTTAAEFSDHHSDEPLNSRITRIQEVARSNYPKHFRISMLIQTNGYFQPQPQTARTPTWQNTCADSVSVHFTARYARNATGS